jgi:hypothetical protein
MSEPRNQARVEATGTGKTVFGLQFLHKTGMSVLGPIDGIRGILAGLAQTTAPSSNGDAHPASSSS